MILPEFKGKIAAYWNTDRWAYKLSNELDKNSFKSPHLKHERKERLAENAMRILGADYLYGGWLEDRSFIWRGSYMEPSKFLHIGTDFVVPAGSMVVATRACEVVQIYCDTPEECGWGARVMVKLLNHNSISDMHLLYGHLSLNTLAVSVGDVLEPNNIIGYIGKPEENGGWSPHLHLQAITGDVTEYLNDPASLDGYGELSKIEEMARKFPDPIIFADLK